MSSAFVRPVQRHAMVAVEEKDEEDDWPMMERRGELLRGRILLGSGSGELVGALRLARFVRKLKVVMKRSCRSIHGSMVWKTVV